MKVKCQINLIVLMVAMLLPGCWSMKNVERRAGLRKNHIHLKDLGPEYLKFKNTDYDFFNKKKMSKDVGKPLKVKFNTFKIKELDAFIKKSNVLYTRFQYAEKSTQSFNGLLAEILSKDSLRVSDRELDRALRKRTTKDLELRRKIESAFRALKLTSHSLKKMLAEAKGLLSNSDEIVSGAISTVKNKPSKAVLANKITLESKRTIKRLHYVVKRLPKLIKKVGSSLNTARRVSQTVKKYTRKK